jgi:hypothetical protein
MRSCGVQFGRNHHAKPTSLGMWSDCITPHSLHSNIPQVYAIRPRSNAIGLRVKMALLHKMRSALMLNARSLPLRQFRTTRRNLHLAPPYLLEDYIPRYHLLSSVDASKKRSLAYAHLRECNLCPRLCGVNRYETTGVCLIGAETVKVNTIAPHFGEGR